MARIITDNTKFNPFSFEDMLKPLALYAQEYRAQEDAINTLATNASIWNGMANEQSDPYAYSLYKGYADDLASQAEILSKEGLSPTSRRAMLKLKERYNSEILPIEKASKRRDALAEEQRKTELTNPTILWERRANDMSLDDFINNPNIDYGKSVSGATLTAQVAAAASALAKEIRDDPDKIKNLAGGDFYEYIKKRGFSSKAILEAIMEDPNASPILTGLVENTINASGAKSWADTETLTQAYNYAKQGLWNAVGQDESQIVQNWRAAENLQHSHALARERERRQYKAEKLKPRAILDKDGNPTGKQYDPSIGMVTDKDGNILMDQSDNPKPNGKNSKTTLLKDKPLNDQGTTLADAAKITSSKDLNEKGLIPIAAVIRHDDYGWQWGEEGQDLGKGNSRLLLNKDKIPKLKNPNKPELGYEVTSGARSPFGTSESNLVNNWGNITYNPDHKAKLEYVSDSEYLKLPENLQLSIEQAALEKGISPGEHFIVYRVKGTSSWLLGRDSPEYSYLICRER